MTRLMVHLYVEEGWSVRRIATAAGMAYAAVHRLIVEDGGVTLRGHGGTRATK